MNGLRGWARHPRRDEGVATLELVAMLPVTFAVVAGVVQLVLGISTVQAANDAARQGARAYSLDRDVSGAVADSLPDAVDVQSLQTFGPDHGVTVTVAVPRVARLLPEWTITRTAVMP